MELSSSDANAGRDHFARLPPELLCLIFEDLIHSVSVEKGLRYQLVSKAFQSNITSAYVTSSAFDNRAIANCRNKDLVKQRLHWRITHCHRDKDAEAAQLLEHVERYLKLCKGTHDHCDVLDAVLHLLVCEMVMRRWKYAFIDRASTGLVLGLALNTPLLWWTKKWEDVGWLHHVTRMSKSDRDLAVSFSIACALDDRIVVGTLQAHVSLLMETAATIGCAREIFDLGYPPQAAMRFGRTDLARELIDQNPSHISWLLPEALLNGNLDTLSMILERRSWLIPPCCVRAGETIRFSLLHGFEICCRLDMLAAFDLLMKSEVYTATQSTTRQARQRFLSVLLNYCCRHSSVSVAQRILDMKPALNINLAIDLNWQESRLLFRKWQHQETALLTAARHGHLDMIKLLLRGGADVNKVDGSSGQSALGIAAHFRHLRCIQFLHQAGAKPFPEDEARSLFEWVVMSNDLEFIKLLQATGFVDEARTHPKRRKCTVASS